MEIFIVWNALKRHERLCDSNDYCHVEVPTLVNKTLKYNHGEKSLKTPFAVYADLDCLLIKKQSCQNNPNESYTERKAMDEPCAYALVHLIQKKTNTIFIEERVVLKGFVVI